VPFYISGQVVAGICAGFTLRLLFGDYAHIGATLPAGTNGQSFVLEIIVTFLLMFVVSAVATDTRAVSNTIPDSLTSLLFALRVDKSPDTV
jgi:aquaporin NIP